MKSKKVWTIFSVAVTLGVLLGAGLALIPVFDYKYALDLAVPYTVKHAPQETPLDPFQHLPYFPAILVAFYQVFRNRRSRERRLFWILLGSVSLFLLWRELPYDERILGANTFSYAKYLTEEHIPILLRLSFAVVSMALISFLGLWTLFRVYKAPGKIFNVFKQNLFSAGGALLVLSFFFLGLAQAFDKHRSTDKLLHLNISAFEIKDYVEESLEVLGPYFLSAAVVILAVSFKVDSRKEEDVPDKATAPG